MTASRVDARALGISAPVRSTQRDIDLRGKLPAYGRVSDVVRQAFAILRKYGTDAHVYLPGIGVINGLTAGNYLDSAGTTPATVDNPVGLVLDGAGSVSATEIATPFNNTYTNNTGVVTAGGTLTATAAAAGFMSFKDGNSISVGKTYRISFDYSTNTNFQPFVGGTGGLAVLSGSGTHVQYIVAGATSRIQFNASGTLTGTISNLSVKEVTGIHATQATTANKPILRRGIVNLYQYSRNYSQGIWTKSNVTLSAGQSDSSGGTNATRLIETAVSNAHNVAQTYTSPVGTYTIAAKLKAGERTKAIVAMSDLSTGDAGIRVNLADGTLESAGLAVGSWTNITSSIEALSNGYYLVKVTGTRGAGTSHAGRVGLVNEANAAIYLGDITKGLYVHEVGMFTGDLSGTEIPLTTTAPASSSTGNYWWQFSDATDNLKTNPATFLANMDCFVAFKRLNTNTQIVFASDAASVNYAFMVMDGTAARPDVNSGAPTYLVNGSSVASTRTALNSAVTVGAYKVIEANNLNLSNAAWTALTWGAYGSGYSLLGDVGVIILCPALTASERVIIRKFVGSLSGLSI